MTQEKIVKTQKSLTLSMKLQLLSNYPELSEIKDILNGKISSEGENAEIEQRQFTKQDKDII